MIDDHALLHTPIEDMTDEEWDDLIEQACRATAPTLFAIVATTEEPRDAEVIGWGTDFGEDGVRAMLNEEHTTFRLGSLTRLAMLLHDDENPIRFVPVH